MAYGDFKDLKEELLLIKSKDLKYDVYQRGLASVVYKSFDEKLMVVVLNVHLKMSN